MARSDRRSLAVLVLLVAAGRPASAGTVIAQSPPGAKAPPEGASALDALALLRDAESHAYRLVDDGVRTFACRVESSSIDALEQPGGPLAAHDVVVTLWWKEGETRVVVEGASDADRAVIESIENLVRPIPALILPAKPSQGLIGCSFRRVGEGSVLRPGDRGVEARSHALDIGIDRALFAVNREGLLVGERLDRPGGATSEFRHDYVLQGGRYLLEQTQGWLVGRRVAARLTWGALVGDRPVPTSIVVRQADILAQWPEDAGVVEFVLSNHRINVDPPAKLFE